MTVATDPLTKPIALLKGVGETRAKAFAALELNTLGDLLEYFPRNYLFESSERQISQLQPKMIQIARGEVTAVDYIASRPRPRFEATIDDGTGKLGLVWFNGAYLRTIIHPGQQVRVKGPVRYFRELPQMSNPKWQLLKGDEAAVAEAKFRPIYSASARLTSEAIARVMADNLPEALPHVREWFEEGFLKQRHLPTRAEAYAGIHQPTDQLHAQRARHRMMYDELMLMQLGLGIGKRLREGRFTAPRMRIDTLLDQRIRKRFAFELTGAQQHAIYDILKDVQTNRPMNRLLQGDVGSGKTAVALYIMLTAVANKLQAAMLAPTEVLAEQHYLTLCNVLRDSGVKIGLFTSRTRRQAKNNALTALANGELHLAVGTQSLIQEHVEFANLGLVVVDEQHKLGVRQRAVLKEKGLAPHYLVMTATPIPRTLALSYFADFDLSTIDELPPGRQPVRTTWLRGAEANKAYNFIRKEVVAGHQAYVVLPQIEDSGVSDLKSVRKEFERLAKGPLVGLNLDMLHGQMSTEEKQEIMARFRGGTTQVLVSTTVIEVGVDIANATVMVIDNADRFGISQLHQLRGRVGRSELQSHCILIADAGNERAAARLRSMTETHDGFKIAEMDLQIRGPGEFFGTRQHGLPEFRVTDITRELGLLAQAKEDALELLKQDPGLKKKEHAALREALLKQFGEDLLLGQVG